MQNGYVKLYRKLLENPIIMKDSDHLAIWIYLLLNATHTKKDVIFKNERITLKPGQLITGRKIIAKKLKVSESKTERVINCLKNEHQIEQQTSNQNRLISIVNWHEYQLSEQQFEQQVNNERTTSEQRVNTNNNIKNIKNDNNIKKENNKKKKYFENEELNNLFLEFLEVRKKKKAVNSERAINMLLKKLSNYDDETKTKMIEQSILNSWKDIYEVKEKEIKKYSDEWWEKI